MPDVNEAGDGIARMRTLDQRLHDDRLKRALQDAENCYDSRDREGLLALIRRLMEPKA